MRIIIKHSFIDSKARTQG